MVKSLSDGATVHGQWSLLARLARKVAQRAGRNKIRPWNILGPSARMKTIALIDTWSEVPGVSLGILVSTHRHDGRFRQQRRLSRMLKAAAVTSEPKS
jgi:hypothetical protein